MKNYKQIFINSLIISITFFWIWGIFLTAFAAINTVNSGDALTANSWNNLISNIFWKDMWSGKIVYTWWNVWIWNSNPSSKLDIAWDLTVTWKLKEWGNNLIPAWAIMAFNLASCPAWWSEYTAARGRFLRWIDSSWTNDVVRIAWNIQADDFKSHNHTVTDNWNSITIYDINWDAWWNYWTLWRSDSRHTAWIPFVISNNWWTETRPKNVAVLYCVKD